MTTKEQERKILTKIASLIEEAGGAESYIGMAFEGCLLDAESNIEDDAGNSYYLRWEQEVKKGKEREEALKNAESALDDAGREIGNLKSQITELDGAKNFYYAATADAQGLANALQKDLDAANDKVRELTALTITLKAKLYDLLVQE